MDGRIILFVFALATSVWSHDLNDGSNTEGHKVFDENKEANPALWRQTNNLTIVANNSETISGIFATDLRPDKDGDIKIVEGGVGQRNVTLELKSPTVLRGYNFHIEVYAVPATNQEMPAKNNEQVKLDNPTQMSKVNIENINKLPENAVKTNSQETHTNSKIDAAVSKDKKIINVNGASDSSNTSPEYIFKDGKRQIRDTENKNKPDLIKKPEKINEHINTPQGNKDVSTIFPELSTPNMHMQESKQIEEKSQKAPLGQEHGFNPMRVKLYEVHEMPESTAKNVPITDFKNMQGKVTPFSKNDDKDSKNINENLNHAHLHTNVDGTQRPAVSVTSVPLHIAGSNQDSTNLRHKRNTAQRTEDIKPFHDIMKTEKPLLLDGQGQAEHLGSMTTQITDQHTNPLLPLVNNKNDDAQNTDQTLKNKSVPNFPEVKKTPTESRGRVIPPRFGFQIDTIDKQDSNPSTNKNKKDEFVPKTDEKITTEGSLRNIGVNPRPINTENKRFTSINIPALNNKRDISETSTQPIKNDFPSTTTGELTTEISVDPKTKGRNTRETKEADNIENSDPKKIIKDTDTSGPNNTENKSHEHDKDTINDKSEIINNKSLIPTIEVNKDNDSGIVQSNPTHRQHINHKRFVSSDIENAGDKVEHNLQNSPTILINGTSNKPHTNVKDIKNGPKIEPEPVIENGNNTPVSTLAVVTSTEKVQSKTEKEFKPTTKQP